MDLEKAIESGRGETEGTKYGGDAAQVIDSHVTEYLPIKEDSGFWF